MLNLAVPCSQRESREGRHHASSLVAVGLTAAIYHASSGSFRKIARKVIAIRSRFSCYFGGFEHLLDEGWAWLVSIHFYQGGE